jgi:hypothetical protein
MKEPMVPESDPVTDAMRRLYEPIEGPPDAGATCPKGGYEDVSKFLATEFRLRLRAVEVALADRLPPAPWNGLAYALSVDGYIMTTSGLRRLGPRDDE